MKSMNIDELWAIKREMETVGRLAQRDMQLMEVVGVLILMYRDTELEIERQVLSYALVLLLEKR
ncbi:MAG: hypothetical protein ACR2H5_11615 [Ktedonobacteraceae bacterium]